MDLKTALERARELDRQRGTVSTNSALAQRAAAGAAAQQAAQQSAEPQSGGTPYERALARAQEIDRQRGTVSGTAGAQVERNPLLSLLPEPGTRASTAVDFSLAKNPPLAGLPVPTGTGQASVKEGFALTPPSYRNVGYQSSGGRVFSGGGAQEDGTRSYTAPNADDLWQGKYIRYMQAQNEPDFAEKSAYRSTRYGDAKANVSGYITDTGFGDVRYDYINRDKDARSVQGYMDTKSDAAFLGLDDSERKEMTDEEIAVFNYLYAQDTANGDAEHRNAYAYIDFLTGDLNARQRAAAQEKWAEYANEHPVKASAFSVMTSPMKGLSYIGQMTDYLKDGKIDQNAGYNKFSYGNSAIRGEVSKKIEESGKWGKVGSFLYQTGMSMGDFLLNTAITGGNQALSLAIMGTGAAADATIEAKDRGLTDDQAFTLGTIAGLAEVITEKVSIEALLDKTTLTKSAMGYFLKNTLAEGSEEVGSDLINLLADILVSKDKSEWQTSIDAYEAEGMSESDALWHAVRDQALNMGLDFLGGALSGAAMSGPVAGVNAISRANAENRTGRALGAEGADTLVNIGLSMDGEAKALAEKLNAKQKSGKALTNREVGQLYSSVADGLSAEKVAALVRSTNENAAPVEAAESASPYTEQEAAEIRKDAKTFRNVVAGLDMKVSEFFSKWRNGRKSHQGEKLEKLYLGKLDQASLGKIGDILGYQLSARDVIVTNDDVKHVSDQHPELENWVFDSLPEVISSPDSIIRGHEGTGRNAGKTGIIFQKTMPNGNVVSIQFDNPSRETMQITTVYVTKKAKGTTSKTTAGDPTAVRTPEASEPATSAAFNVAQTGAGVNTGENASGVQRRPGLVQDAVYQRAHLSSTTRDALDALGRALGVEVRMAEDLGDVNATYENGVITLSLRAGDPVMTSAIHEAVHRVREAAPEAYDTLESFVRRAMSEGQLEYNVKLREALYGTENADYLTEEVVADAFGRMLNERSILDRFTREHRSTAQKLRDALRDIVNAVRRLLGGQNKRLTQSQRESFSDLENRLSAMEALFGDALEKAGNGAESSGEARRYSIEETRDGKKYVRADRQVIFGNDPQSWSEQLEDYINGKIRRGQDVTLIGADGDELRLTATSAGKLSDNHTGNGRTMSDETFERKVNAASHIDELARVSTRGKRNVQDYDGRHGSLASGGWNYRTAYFKDFDGKYYEVTISTAQNADGRMIYNIGQMQERSDSQINGSSAANSGALWGDASSSNNIRNSGENVNSKSSRSDRELLDEYIKKYGPIPKGERASRDVELPRQTGESEKVSRTVRTVMEAKATPDEALPSIEKLAAKGKFSYEVYSDKQAISDAAAQIEDVGWTSALEKWTKAVKSGNVSKANTAMGWALYNNAVNKGDTDLAIDVLEKMVEHQRSAAQAVQATRILKQMSPETQLYGVQRSVANLQAELNERYGDKKAPELKLDPDLAERLLNAETQEARDAALRDIYRDIGRQMPSRFRDRWNAWRYLAMLGNARTHGRNVVGNLGFALPVAIKDAAATGIEAAVYRLSGGRMERSKAFGKDFGKLARAAWSDYAKVQETALGGGKYSDMQNANKYVEEGRKIFGNLPTNSPYAAVRTAARTWNNTVGKALESFRKFNGKALDAEDVWFSKPHYAFAMAQFCKANGITAEQIRSGERLEAARDYAILEAQKATYRDTNNFSQGVSQLGRKGFGSGKGFDRGLATFVEGILPFRKTPANILARGVEYSPIGLLNGIYKATAGVAKGKYTAAQAIDSISAGLTGTGLMGLGWFLAAQGLVRGRGGDDDEKRKFEEMQGHQAYSLELPDGTSVTLDWLAPEALPFFVGVNLWEEMSEKKAGENGEVGIEPSEMLSAVFRVSEPMLEMSCLQSLNDVFDTVGYASSKDVSALVSALASAATSYVTQALPTLLGQAERTGESKRYTTYTEKNSFLTGDMQYALGKASARTPGWDFQQIPYIDAWGREENSGELPERAFNNFLNPSYTSKIETSEMEKELLRLYEETGEATVLPDRAPKYLSVLGERVYLSAEDYVQIARARGELSYELVNDLVASGEYKKMGDPDKAGAVKGAYDAAKLEAVRQVFGAEYAMKTCGVQAYEKAQKAVENGSTWEAYYSIYTGNRGVVEDWRKYLNAAMQPFGETARLGALAAMMPETTYEKLEAAVAEGISVYNYVSFRYDIKDLEGDKDKDGNVIPGSKKEKIVEVIDGLNLTSEQKDFLYLQQRYSEDGLRDTPWHKRK